MKKWLKFFCLSFFSHKTSKEAQKHGYTNVFLGFLLAMVFLWAGLVGKDMLPFGTHYKSASDFRATAYSVFANTDHSKRLIAEVLEGDLRVKKQGGEYTEGVLIDTLSRESDKESYSVGGYHVVVDTRPASTFAEVEAYCVSNDGKDTVISYEEYLTLSEVARMNFDFKLKYTGEPLVISDEMVSEYLLYLKDLGGEVKTVTDKVSKDLSEGKITQEEYNKEIYKLYFTNYYPKITEYESTSNVPLLRNYYYHQYISKGISNYLFIFDDYLTGSFTAKGGLEVIFYGFFSNVEGGALIEEGTAAEEAESLVDDFIKGSYRANWFLNAYAYVMNIITLLPFIVLMLLVATLMSYSVLRLRGVESIASLGTMVKLIGSYVWFSGAVSALISILIGFFVKRSMVDALSLALFFVVLLARSMIFVIREDILYKRQSQQKEDLQTEV